MTDYYYKARLQLVEESKEALRKKAEWFRHYIVLASGIFGIQIALYDSNTRVENHLYILAILILGFAIVLGLLASYQEVHAHTRANLRYKENIRVAQRDQKEIVPVVENPSLIFEIAEKTSLTLFLLSVVLFSLSFVFKPDLLSLF